MLWVELGWVVIKNRVIGVGPTEKVALEQSLK